MKPNLDTAAICGLFCGTCPSYIEKECGGCLSIKCTCDCFNGFKDCAKENSIKRCFECKNFPCEKLHDFSKKHIVNGICHHKDVIENLEHMKMHGIDKWLLNQTQTHTCKKCNSLIPWYQKHCNCENK